MNKPLMELVLPRLAQRLHRHLRRYQAGKLNDAQFSRKFETLMQQQFSWLANQGVPRSDRRIVEAMLTQLRDPEIPESVLRMAERGFQLFPIKPCEKQFESFANVENSTKNLQLEKPGLRD